jgi:hypothetical protein
MREQVNQDWQPPCELLEKICGLACRLAFGSPAGAGGYGHGLVSLPLEMLLSRVEPEEASTVLRTMDWLDYSAQVCRLDRSKGTLEIRDLSNLQRTITNNEKSKAMSLTTNSERAAQLISEAGELMRSNGHTSVCLEKLQEAMALAARAQAPMLHGVAASMAARVHKTMKNGAKALALGTPAVAELRAAGLDLEARRLERELDSIMEPYTPGELGEYTEAKNGREETAEVPKERDMYMAIKEKIAGAATDTGTGVVAAFREGLAISGSQQLSDKFVAVFHAKLGHNIPMASSPIGQQIERVAFPALIHLVAGLVPDKVPGAALVQATCMRAITGVAKDDGDLLIKTLLPVFAEVLKMGATDGGFDLASMMGTTTVEQMMGQEQGQALAKQPEMSALAEALSKGFADAEEGEPVEVTVTMKKGKKKEKARAMEDNDIVPPAPSK